MTREINLIGKEILNYRIERQLGRGGMGSVYLAANKNIEQKVAIKVLNENFSDNDIIRQRFLEEAQLLCSLDHPNIVKFMNFVENEDGIFLIMEYVDGITLEDFISQKNGLIVEKRAHEMFDEILSAFAYAHKKGVVHRDIKPANIILANDNEGNIHIKVLDFGIAKIISDSGEDEKGWIIGTPSYMSPEQVQGEKIDARSDIYSLGVLLHQMLTGRTPYDETTLSELNIKDKVVNEPLPRMKEFYPYISDKIQKVVDKATAKNPGLRFQTCNDFRKEIKAILNPDPVHPVVKYGIIGLLILFIIGGFFTWDYYRTKVSYYKDYVEQWGVPKGIGSLSSNEMKHREASYRFEYRKRKLIRMSHVNSKGKVVSHSEYEHAERANDMLLFYSDNGMIDYIKCLDPSGKTLYKKDYDEKFKTAIFKYDDEYGTEMNMVTATTRSSINIFDESGSNKGKISRYLLTYDKNGYLVELKYAGFQNVLVCDNDGLYGKKYVRDKKGRVIEEHFLGYNGIPKANKNGLAIKKFSYADNDNWMTATYYAANGELSSDNNGCPILKLEYDKYGNRKKETYTDGKGNLVLRKDNGAASFYYEHDDNGNRIKYGALGTDGKPCYLKDGYSASTIEYDKNGFLAKQTYLDINNKPLSCGMGCASMKYSNDDKGNILEWSYWDENNKPVISLYEYHKCVAQYDSVGNQISRFYYNTKDSLTLIQNSYSGCKSEYNAQNNMTKQCFFGLDKKPCAEDNGIFCCKSDYDVRGNNTRVAYYDSTQTKLILSNEKIAGINHIYDENGNEIECNFFDTNNKPCMGNVGYSKWKATYDNRGNQLTIRNYNANGDLILAPESGAGYNYQYDERGNIVESYVVGMDEKLIAGGLITRTKYDQFDNEIESSEYDKDGKPSLNKFGYHKVVRQYNERHQELKEEFLDIEGKLVFKKGTKYSTVEYKYDNKGNLVEISYWETSGKPTIDENNVHKQVSEYNTLGYLIRQVNFDSNNNPVSHEKAIPERQQKYDNRGNMVEISCWDGKGNRIVGETGSSIKQMEYDKRNQPLSESYYDTKENPCLAIIDGKSYWKVEAHYNNNLITEQKYLDIDGSPMSKGYAYVRYKYNEQDQISEIAYYDSKENLCNTTLGLAKIVYSSFNEAGLAHKALIYDASGKFLGTLSRKTVYDEWGTASYEPNNTTTGSQTSSWQSTWNNWASQCPQSVGNGIDVSSIQVYSSSCNVTCVLKHESKYDISASKIENYKNVIHELASNWRKNSSMPQNIKVHVTIVDKVQREITQTNY